MLAWKKYLVKNSLPQTLIIVSENSWAARMSVFGMRRLPRGNGK